MKGGDTILSARQNKVIQLLLEGKSKSAAAKGAGVSARMVYNYFQSDEFMEELRRRQGELVAEAAGRGRAKLSDAMSVFETIMNDRNQNGQIRVQAARSLLQFSLELDERENILRRIDELEKTLIGGGEHG
nr:hypothetical protein [uncultured Oscillibacter sp.]